MESILAGFVAFCILIELWSMRSEVCGEIVREEREWGSVNNGNGEESRRERGEVQMKCRQCVRG